MKKGLLRTVAFAVATTLCLQATGIYAEELQDEEVIVASVTESAGIEGTDETGTDDADSALAEMAFEEEEFLNLINNDIVAMGVVSSFMSISADGEEEELADEDIVAFSLEKEEEIQEEDPEVLANQIGVRAPEGFAVEMGSQAAYKHTYLDLVTESNNVYVFEIPKANVAYFYRVYSVEENNDGVTYWGWFASNKISASLGTIIEVTEEQLCLNDEGMEGERNADTVDEYLTNNEYDTQDILITGNADGYIDLKIGQTWNLDCYRMWEIIESFMNNQISMPDFHISVTALDGNATDIISIEKNTGCGSSNTITALQPGTCILKVTYDAVTVMNAMGKDADAAEGYFSAIAPENTAVFVVSVAQYSAEVNDGINLDAEIDVQYYTGENGAAIIATPDEGSTVTVSRAVYDENGKMQLTSFTDEGVVQGEDGNWEIAGLTEGSSVIKVTDSNGVSTYQVIKSKQIGFTVVDAAGNVLNDLSEVKAGDVLTITADRFYDVFMKSSGVYNGSATLQFTDQYGNTFKAAENAKGFAITYTQASDAAYRTVKITVPDEYDGTEPYSLNCEINRNTRFGLKLGGHRTVFKTTGETKVNGYVVTTAAAVSTSQAVEIADMDAFLADPNQTPYVDKSEKLGLDILDSVDAKVLFFSNERVNR